MQFTMMTSILEPALRKQIASEMIRVAKPGGYILWYDFRYNNPANRYTRAIGKRELRELFGELSIDLHTSTLVPQLARKLGPISALLLKFLNRLPILRTHIVALIGPKG